MLPFRPRLHRRICRKAAWPGVKSAGRNYRAIARDQRQGAKEDEVLACQLGGMDAVAAPVLGRIELCIGLLQQALGRARSGVQRR